MSEYFKFLATEVLSSRKPVTYRVLSRALKVHVNTAKQILFEFYQLQNQKLPNSIYATYLIYGARYDTARDDGDVEMDSAASPSDWESFSDPCQRCTLVLVEEGDLKDTLKDYKYVYSIHIYSLSPSAGQDMQLLSQSNSRLQSPSANLEVIGSRCQYGGVANTKVRLKDRKGYKPLTASTLVSDAAPHKIPGPRSSNNAPTKTEPLKQAPIPSQQAFSSSAKVRNPGGNQSFSSNIMQSFAKASAKTSNHNVASQLARPSEPVANLQATLDEDAEDDGEDDNAAFLSKPRELGNGFEAQKSRVQREAELRLMMEQDDDMSDPPHNHDVEKEERSSRDPPENDAEDKSRKAEPLNETRLEPTVTEVIHVEGRRRGKRRVVKKKQAQDEEGYLITVQEAVWESFSEDEASQSQKTTTTAPSSSTAPTKTKKQPPKGQGSIMSFFAKKA